MPLTACGVGAWRRRGYVPLARSLSSRWRRCVGLAGELGDALLGDAENERGVPAGELSVVAQPSGGVAK